LNSSVILYAATFPLDLVRRRKQLEGAGGRARVYNTGLFGTFKHIFRSEGLRGLYRGILPEYYKVVPGVGICFMTYETLKMVLAEITTAWLHPSTLESDLQEVKRRSYLFMQKGIRPLKLYLSIEVLIS